MAEAPAPGLWAELRSKRPTYDDALATTPVSHGGVATDMLFGMDQQGDLHLLIPVEGGPAGQKTPDLQGLRVRHRHISEVGQYLDLMATACHEHLFSPLCGEIITAVLDHGRKPWETVFATIRAWQSAWKPIAMAMGKTVQVGLFGELLTLERVMIPAIGPRAVHHWSGPDQERHDFVGTTLHLEVKTTRKGRHEHEISRLDQLRIPGGRSLMVVSVLVEESATGAETIASRMDSISDLLRTDPAASDTFQAKMVQMGWSEDMRRSGELLKFHLRGSLLLPVDDFFPRLPDDFSPPTGVVSVHYTVDLANLPSMDLDEAMRAVSTGF